MVASPIFLTLQNKKQLTHDVYELEYLSEDILSIVPGQFLLCDTAWDQKLRRSYSVSWVEWNRVYFIIKRVSNGTGWSVAICDQEIGHRMQVWWPMGRFILQENAFPKVFIGTGTGFAPLYFMLKNLLEQRKEQREKSKKEEFLFVFWVRELRDVFYLNELEKWRKEGGFDYEIYCSREVRVQEQETEQKNFLLPEKHHHGRVTDFFQNSDRAHLSRGDACKAGGLDEWVKSYYTGEFAHIPYNPELTDFAREQRQTESLAEKRMWYDILKGKKLSQYKFTRQKPLLSYIADFYCSEFGLVIEVDGDNHQDQKEYDEKRTKELESYGLEVLRFHNLRAMEEISAVENEIIERIEKRKIELLKSTSLNPPVYDHPPWQGGSAQLPTTNYQLLFTHPDTEFYICGSPAMVTEVRGILKNLGISEGKIFFEQY